ncbi:MAG TPA: DUF2171 domain-containing protein [Gaiellaceae bacterium]
MPDPVSWFVIEAGWSVVDAEGQEIGKVSEVTGDSDKDIFDGLSITSGILRTPRYVPSEQVDAIVEGQVSLKLSGDEVMRLEEFTEPPPQERISSEKAPIWLRIGDWFRRR